MELRLATCNIAGGVDTTDRFYSRRGNAKTAARVARARDAIAELARFIVEQRFDVVTLQEVDVCHNGADTLDQAAGLAAACGMRHVFLPCFDYDLAGRWTVTTGVATLTRLDILDHRAHRFAQRGSLRRRLKARVLGAKRALEVTVAAGPIRLRIVNAHLTHDHDGQKEHELATLLAHCDGAGPSVLIGDLNTTPPATRSPAMYHPHYYAADGCFALLERHRGRFQGDPRVFDPVRVAELCTYPAKAPDLKVDHALVFAGDADVTASAETIHARTATSDHLPMSITLRIAG